MSKYSKEIQDKTRAWVGELFTGVTSSNPNERMRFIRNSFIRTGEDMTLLGLIKTSHVASHFLPPAGYGYSLEEVYVGCGYKQIMSYEQFVFALPQIWYTTLFRLIQVWEAECPETELAY